MGKVVLVTGGARSGKSIFAEEYCINSNKKVAYIATAKIIDDEMNDRVIKHRKQRPQVWDTWEISSNLSIELDKIANTCEIALLDCATIMVSNLMFDKAVDYEIVSMELVNKIESEIKNEFLKILNSISSTEMDLVIVTNEVGQGIVSENRLSRIYVDIVGRINQLCAKKADEVYTLISGIPLKIKG